MAAKPQKILVAGDVQGCFQQLFKRVDTIQNKNGNFDLLLCVGEFFGTDMSSWEPYKSGRVKVPISTLILGPCQEQFGIYFNGSEGVDLCEGVTYLGKQGRFTGSTGLSIAYISGLESSTPSGGDCAFTKKDVHSLISPCVNDGSFKGIDILITSQWPRNVEKYATAIDRKNKKFSQSVFIAEAARVLRPRYHFAGLEDFFYERQPYRNHQVLLEPARHTTRFIGIASVSNKEKQKYLYAMNITPLSKMDPTELVKQPQDVTECPYIPLDMATTEEDGPQQQFFYDMTSRGRGNKRRSDRGRGRGGRGGGGGEEKGSRGDNYQSHEKKPRKEPQPTGPCWFCLGSPEVEKHLVVSVSDKAYLALAKGGLVPDHVLILPVHHYQSYLSCPMDVLEQIDQYKSCLRKMFKAQDKSVVFFERNFRTQHLQIQAVPFPRDAVVDIKDTFASCAEAENIELAEIPKHSDLKQIVSDGEPYFYVELPTKEKLLHRIQKNFPLQFGREAVCEPPILNMPERVDWRNCKLDKEEETDLATAFKLAFRAFDFNFS